MHIKSIHTKGFKRFTDLLITDLSSTARLIVVTGPNGCGKSSLFDAFRAWQSAHGLGFGIDPMYHLKSGVVRDGVSQLDLSNIDFHEQLPSTVDSMRRVFYIRSAYRNQSDFTSSQLQRVGPIVDAPQSAKMIDIEATVSDNYSRMVSSSIESLFDANNDELSVRELRDKYVGEVRQSMSRIFGDVHLKSLGDPFVDGSFYFEKGSSNRFHYKNLSAGEKGVFDLLLDFIIKRRSYDNTIYCIDEPETHLHSRLQAQLLDELMLLLPASCQLWISTHAIGMMRRARDLQQANPCEVVFLDFSGRDFDDPVVLAPAQVDRSFWANVLNVALDDLAKLVAPSRVVLCEGRPLESNNTRKAEFDAECFRVIFTAEFSDTDFISVGNERDVRSDRLGVGKTIQTLMKGTEVLRVVDQDDRSPKEISDLRIQGVRVLSRRHLEAYLMDDEVLTKLCNEKQQSHNVSVVLAAKEQALAASVERGNPHDDIKSAAGHIYTETKRIMQLTQCGNTTDAFLRDTLAPLITPGMAVYRQLKRDIFEE